jgi:hypothetical protein
VKIISSVMLNRHEYRLQTNATMLANQSVSRSDGTRMIAVFPYLCRMSLWIQASR